MKRYALAAVAALLTMAAAPAIAAPSDTIMAAISDPGRPESDKVVDALRKPALTLDFAGVKTGQKIAELWPASPYFTRILAKAVGDSGKVYSIVSVGGSARPPAPVAVNVTPIVSKYSDIALPKGLDMVWSVRNYHALQSAMPDLRPFNKLVFASLKSGGVYLVLDYAAFWDAQPYVGPILNRSKEAVVRDEVEAAGFLFVGSSDILRNPADDKSKPAPKNGVGGNADQYILKFVKP
jgi:predicted methyltransferase